MTSWRKFKKQYKKDMIKRTYGHLVTLKDKDENVYSGTFKAVKPYLETRPNGIKADNRVENLEWCNNSMNQLHAWRIGLQVVSGKAGKPKRKIVQYSKEGKVIKVWDSITECAHAFGDKRTCALQKVLHHLAHYNTYHGYKFEYYGKIQ